MACSFFNFIVDVMWSGSEDEIANLTRWMPSEALFKGGRELLRCIVKRTVHSPPYAP
jgi:hypothetical protein